MVDLLESVVNRIRDVAFGVQILVDSQDTNLVDIEGAVYPVISRRTTTMIPQAGVGEVFKWVFHIWSKSEIKWYDLASKVIRGLAGFVPIEGFTPFVFEEMSYQGFNRTNKLFYGSLYFSNKNYTGSL